MNLNDAVNTWGAIAPTPVIHEKKSIIGPLIAILSIGIIGFIIYNEIQKQIVKPVIKDNRININENR